MAVSTCFLPSDDGSPSSQHYYIVDTEPELPTDNIAGDLAYTKDSTKLWKATAPGAWSDITGDSETFTAENKDTVTILAGQAVTIHTSGTGILRADASTKVTYCVGLALMDIPVGVVGVVTTDGPFTLTDWTNVIGAAALTAKGRYFLDDTSGMLTTTPPTAFDNISQFIGRALSPTKFEINIEEFIVIKV